MQTIASEIGLEIDNRDENESSEPTAEDEDEDFYDFYRTFSTTSALFREYDDAAINILGLTREGANSLAVQVPDPEQPGKKLPAVLFPIQVVALAWMIEQSQSRSEVAFLPLIVVRVRPFVVWHT